MNVLIIEPYVPDTCALIEGLRGMTHSRVSQAETLAEGFTAMEETYFDIVLVTIHRQASLAAKVLKQIRSHATHLLVRPPDVILLVDGLLPMQEALRCRELGTMCMRRDLPQAVYEEARLMFWKRATRKYDVTFRVDFRNGHHFLFAGSPPVRVELGAQLTRLAVLLLGGNESYTVEFLADELSVCRQSVKKYFRDLRQAFVQVQTQLGIASCMQTEIFWMEKRPGGTVCGVKANVVWN